MAQGNFSNITGKTNEAWSETVNKALEAFTLAGEMNRDVSSRTVDVSSAIARESVQYLGDVQAAIRRGFEEAREIWKQQYTLVQELPQEPMALTQKAVALSWEGGERITRLGDAQREALTRFSGILQNLLEKASRENQESFTLYSEKLLKLYGLKN
jgi:hypothetical protein